MRRLVVAAACLVVGEHRAEAFDWEFTLARSGITITLDDEWVYEAAPEDFIPQWSETSDYMRLRDVTAFFVERATYDAGCHLGFKSRVERTMGGTIAQSSDTYGAQLAYRSAEVEGWSARFYCFDRGDYDIWVFGTFEDEWDETFVTAVAAALPAYVPREETPYYSEYTPTPEPTGPTPEQQEWERQQYEARLRGSTARADRGPGVYELGYAYFSGAMAPSGSAFAIGLARPTWRDLGHRLAYGYRAEAALRPSWQYGAVSASLGLGFRFGKALVGSIHARGGVNGANGDGGPDLADGFVVGGGIDGAHPFNDGVALTFDGAGLWRAASSEWMSRVAVSLTFGEYTGGLSIGFAHQQFFGDDASVWAITLGMRPNRDVWRIGKYGTGDQR